MHKILEEYFKKTYPTIFVDMYGPVEKTCMHWGITVDDGWFFLLDNLCRQIQYHINDPEKEIPPVVALQVKEKFGRLTFYYKGGDDEVRHMVKFAGNMSSHICEKCGAYNETVGRTDTLWIRSLCRSCADKKGVPLIQQTDLIVMFNQVKQNPTKE